MPAPTLATSRAALPAEGAAGPQGGPAARRRLFLSLGLASLAAGCGFQLRRAPTFAFKSIYVGAAPTSALAQELKRDIASSGTVTVADTQVAAQVILDVTSEQREKVVVGLNASGQVREFELRIRVHFRLRTPDGKELIPDSEIVQQQDVSYNESAALAKEQEEQMLYRSLQTDIVQQLMRRLAAVKTI
jgi:LPS-assembly lipoprotein